MEKRSVFIVDDNKNFLESAINFLVTDKSFSVVGWALNGADAIENIKKFKPEIVLLDFSLPDMNGFEVTRKLKELPEAPKIIMISINSQENYRAEAENSGADAYVCKSEFGNRIIPIIEELLSNSES